ncbi:hypothetical protein [Fundidesulfovibrio butyratiphilus]
MTEDILLAIHPVEKSFLGALLRKSPPPNGCQLRFGLDFFSRLASTFFEQAARIDFLGGQTGNALKKSLILRKLTVMSFKLRLRFLSSKHRRYLLLR